MPPLARFLMKCAIELEIRYVRCESTGCPYLGRANAPVPLVARAAGRDKPVPDRAGRRPRDGEPYGRGLGRGRPAAVPPDLGICRQSAVALCRFRAALAGRKSVCRTA